MHVSLVYAGIAGKGFDSIGQGMDSGWISHGLAILSAVLKQQGHEVDLIDLRSLRGWDHLREELLRRRPDVCGLTMMSVDFNPVMQASTSSRRRCRPASPWSAGRTRRWRPTKCCHSPDVDYVVTQEGEIALPRLLRDLEQGEQATAPDRRRAPGPRQPALFRPRPVPGRVAALGLRHRLAGGALRRRAAAAVRHRSSPGAAASTTAPSASRARASSSATGCGAAASRTSSASWSICGTGTTSSPSCSTTTA